MPVSCSLFALFLFIPKSININKNFIKFSSLVKDIYWKGSMFLKHSFQTFLIKILDFHTYVFVSITLSCTPFFITHTLIFYFWHSLSPSPWLVFSISPRAFPFLLLWFMWSVLYYDFSAQLLNPILLLKHKCHDYYQSFCFYISQINCHLGH